MPVCCVYRCNNRKGAKFPRDEELKKKWIVAIRREERFHVSSCTIVCWSHFRPDDFQEENFYTGAPLIYKKLKKGVVPSVFFWKKQTSRIRQAPGTDQLPSDNQPDPSASCHVDGSEERLSDHTTSADDATSDDHDHESDSLSKPVPTQDTPQCDVRSAGPLYCDSCDYSTVDPSRMKAHRRTHSGKKPYACDACEYKSTSTHNLKRHKLTHLGLKPYTCDHCGHTARSTSNLKVHMRIHSDDQPFVCDVCNYHTKDTTKLKRHVLKCHKGGGDINGVSTCNGLLKDTKGCCRPKFESQSAGSAEQSLSDRKRFSCTVCSYTTAVCKDFNKHLKTHSGERLYVCHLCDYRASTATNLKIHIRVHTGEKPYVCPSCPHRARTGPQLKVHMRTHSGEKPYVCQDCGHKTGQSSLLKKHMKRHHSAKGKLDPEMAEVADFSYVETEAILDNRLTSSGCDVTVDGESQNGASSDIEGVTIKEEATEFFSDANTSGDVGGVTVKLEVMDYDFSGTNGELSSGGNPTGGPNSGVVRDACCSNGDVGVVNIKQEVIDCGYTSFQGSNGELMASEVVSTDSPNSGFLISDVNGVKIKQEVVVCDPISYEEHQQSSDYS